MKRFVEGADEQIDEIYKNKYDDVPRGRCGYAHEVANVASFLVSEDADYVTGSSYVIDGGYMLNQGFPTIDNN